MQSVAAMRYVGPAIAVYCSQWIFLWLSLKHIPQEQPNAVWTDIG